MRGVVSESKEAEQTWEVTQTNESNSQLASGCSMFAATHGINPLRDTCLCVDTGVIDGAINGGREGEGGNKETQ